MPAYRPYSGCRGAQNFITTSRAPRCPCCLTASVRCPLQHTPPHSTTRAHTPAPSCAQSHCRHPKALCLGRRVGLTAEASEPQPVSSCPERYALPELPQVLPWHMPCLAPRESWSDPLRTQLHTYPQLEGSGVWSPRPWGQCCFSPPSLRATELAPYLFPPAGLPGQVLTCFPSAVSRAACPWPPGGVPGSQAGPATEQPCLTGLADSAPPAQQGSAGLGWGLAGGSFGTAHSLPFLVVGASGCLRVMLCRSGLRARSVLKPSAAASFELPTPLWSLYMPPEETVSTA